MTWLSSRLSFLLAGALVCLISPSILSDEPGAAAPEETSGGVKLKWTAPGDDGYDGLALGYDVRYQPLNFGPIDTENEWLAAARVYNLPDPSPAGGRDSVTVFGLVPGMGYYFALKTFDEAYNYSQLSNSPLVVATLMECCQGKVGDASGRDGEVPTLSDVMVMVDHVFISGRPLWCVAEADIDQSGGANPQQGPGGDITLLDVTILVDHLFLGGHPLPDCIH